MIRLRLLAMGVATLAVLATPASAQRCLGHATFSNQPVRVGVGAQFGDGVKGFGASLAVGAASGGFGSIGASTISYDGVSPTGTVFSIGGGGAFPLAPNDKASVCALAQFDLQSGPNLPTSLGTVEASARTIGIGAAIGGVAAEGDGIEFVPFASAAFVNLSATAKLSGFSASNDENFGLLGAGFGIVFARRVNLRAQLSYPVGLANAKVNGGIGLAVSF